MTRLLYGLLAVAAALTVVTGAAARTTSTQAPKSSASPVTLTLLNSDGDLSGVPAVQRFIDRVRQLSGGSVTIEVRPQNDGHAGYEQRVVRAVEANKAQLAWVGTRVWDTLGVNTFRALQAPMLVDSYPLEAAVLRSKLPAEMLAGLSGRGVVGLAVLGDNLRYPAAVKRPLREPADFKGLSFGSYTSATQAAAVHALGARPSPAGWAERGAALESGGLAGVEIDLFTYKDNSYDSIAPFLTVNAPLWPRTTVLIANTNALANLSDEQSRWIKQAANDAAAYSLSTFGRAERLLPGECRTGMRAVLATPKQLASLRRAFAPVYTALRQDVPTAQMIAAINALKRNVKPAPLSIPRGCLASVG